MWNIEEGDCSKILAGMPAEVIQCCVTSPPYWQLRDYGSELGSEENPELFVDKLVTIFREIRRVLKKDGTLWLNLGDTYCGGGGYCPDSPSNKYSKQSTNRGVKAKARPVPTGYKAKDLVGLPWMVALALRKDGWYLRSDIIWEKPNGMPERVTDRPTRTHEYLFLLSKSKKYFFSPIKESGVEEVRNCRSVWRIPQVPYKGAHFAVFPEILVERCILAGTKEGDLVLDPFTGSGTTGVVAGRLRRDFLGLEINGRFCEMGVERIKEAVGIGPTALADVIRRRDVS